MPACGVPIEMTSSDSVELLRKDFTLLASSVSALTGEVAELKLQSAVRDERDKAVREHLARIDTTLMDIKSVARWFLFAFSSSLIGAFVLFVVRGGLNASP